MVLVSTATALFSRVTSSAVVHPAYVALVVLVGER